MKKTLPDSLVLLIAFILYLPFLFLGYGSDNDTYNVLWTGFNFVRTLDYVPSRGPGFFVFETIIFFLNRLGGSFLTNLAVMGMSLITLVGFLRLCRQFNVPHHSLLALILAVHPYYWVNSTCTMDYLFGIGFVFLGIVQVLRGKYFTGGAAMALGAGSRATSILIAAGFLIWYFIVQPEARKKLIQTGAATAFFTLVFYLPPADFAEWTTRFLKPTVGGEEYWTPYLRLGRFVYKNIYFWGLLASIMLIWGVALGFFKRRFFSQSGQHGLPVLALVLILVYELFYWGIPTEPAYLLPTIPFWLILMGVAFKPDRRLLYLLLVVVFLANFVSLNVARPNKVNQATGAIYGLWVEPGHLVQDVQTRLVFLRCGNRPCNWEGDVLE
ncbi:MAG: hypothetical protein IT308_06800 [Anaerolineaceae bacterium]|nr:hypothetical protein [Anaerolineaceae bacterium]